MPTKNREVQATAVPGIVRDPQDGPLKVPQGWVFLKSGDAGLTRRVKSSGPVWRLVEPVKNRLYARGLYAPADRIARAQQELEVERADPAYAKKLEQSRASRAKKQAAYVEDFHAAVVSFLAFAPNYADLAQELARRVTEHATPVGSGTVARTERIPIEDRARAAVVAWMRHQTSAYDHLEIAHVKGERRAVRREIAQVSIGILNRYRKGLPPAPNCPLWRALHQ